MLRLAKTRPLSDLTVLSERDPTLDQELDALSDTALEQVVRERVETMLAPRCCARSSQD